jgi:hypothetical protein
VFSGVAAWLAVMLCALGSGAAVNARGDLRTSVMQNFERTVTLFENARDRAVPQRI